MKSLILILALAFNAGAYAQEWVSVGAAAKVAPSSQAPLIDSSQQASIEVAAKPSKGNSNTLNEELLWQIEQLQQEVSSLRGTIEQQDYQIKQLQEESQQRYLDLDQRLSQLTLQSKPAPQGAVSADVKSKPVVVNSEQAEESYQAAMRLVREKSYPEASAAFDQFIAQYPKHELMGNALYWSGEVWLVQGELDKALAQFERVVKYYPDHAKAADASYKAGVTLHRQNKNAEAKVWFNRVIKNYSGKADSTVNLAKSYLQRLEQ